MTSLLIVDDDKDFRAALADHFIKRGFEVRSANDVTQAARIAEEFTPEWVLLDLKMPGASGLELIPKLLAVDPATRIVVPTGYAGIATAVEAIKLGAIHYLSKPVGTEEIISSFTKDAGNPKVPIDSFESTLEETERRRILSAMERNKNNISAAARELGLHRRTLQRKLDKLRG